MQTVRASSHAYISIKGGYNLEPELLCKWKQRKYRGCYPGQMALASSVKIAVS